MTVKIAILVLAVLPGLTFAAEALRQHGEATYAASWAAKDELNSVKR